MKPSPKELPPRKYGWIPDLPDVRDLRYAAPRHVLRALPPRVDLRPGLPKLHNDQGSLSSCVGNATADAHLFDQVKQGKANGGKTLNGKPMLTFLPSRLMIYYMARKRAGTVTEDSGCYIRDAVKCIAAQGVCPETLWPYIEHQFAAKPPMKCWVEALKYQALQYARVEGTLDQLRGCLAEGFPVVFGFTVYDSFDSPEVLRGGKMSMPGRNDRARGGHAVLMVGYDDATERFIVRNSWGNGWGDKGDFYMPYAYATTRDLADDFWKITLVES